METDYLADIQQSLLGGNPTLRVECMTSCEGLKTLKICKKQAEWSSPVIKYSPGQFTLITITSDSSLSVVRLSHTEEVIEEVDFKVDLGQPPDSALVEFISNSLVRKVQLCHGFEEQTLLLSSLQCTQVLIERFGSSIWVRSRACQGTVEDYGLEVCTECLGVSQHAGLKREVVESWPDIPEDFAEDDEDVDEKEEVKPILKKTSEKKKKGRKKKQEEEEDDEEEMDEDWAATPKKRANKKPSNNFQCPDEDCSTTFSKEMSMVSHILEFHQDKHEKVTDGWGKCSEEGCFHSYKEGVPHYTKHLINHLKNSHPDSPILLAETGQRNECSYCGKVFKYNYSLKKHLETLHEAPTVPCHICGILLKGQKTLITHVKSVHEKSIRHHCPEPGCTMTAVNSHHLKDHIAVVHRGQARYVCSVCGKEHGYYKALKHCQDRHKGRFMHPCTLCDKKYLDKVKLTVHMRVHTGEKPYACPICATRMARLDNLSAHIKKTHGVTWQEAEKMTNTSVKGGPLHKPVEEELPT